MKATHLYSQITSLENLFQAWNEFKKGKRNKKDVQIFEKNLEDNLFALHYQLSNKIYKHSSYSAFNIYDPKFRHIHKAKVLDRIVHHAIVSKIEPIFDKTFIYDSYSCRTGKGMHRAVRRLFRYVRKVSKNYRGSCYALKLDIRKFFDNINQDILLDLINVRIDDDNLLWLIENILKSFSKDIGIPIGNLTSQIFSNIYLNELDQFVKHELRVKYYIRYCDDFVIVSDNRKQLENLISTIGKFLKEKLGLSLHEQKIIIKKHTQGIDFLGYIVLPHIILPRTKTRRRIFKRSRNKVIDLEKGIISKHSFYQSVQSYLGFLKHSNSYKITQKLKESLILD